MSANWVPPKIQFDCGPYKFVASLSETTFDEVDRYGELKPAWEAKIEPSHPVAGWCVSGPRQTPLEAVWYAGKLLADELSEVDSKIDPGSVKNIQIHIPLDNEDFRFLIGR